VTAPGAPAVHGSAAPLRPSRRSPRTAEQVARSRRRARLAGVAAALLLAVATAVSAAAYLTLGPAQQPAPTASTGTFPSRQAP
jgi:hypothetical protein